jgi:hypothetical protein
MRDQKLSIQIYTSILIMFYVSDEQQIRCFMCRLGVMGPAPFFVFSYIMKCSFYVVFGDNETFIIWRLYTLTVFVLQQQNQYKT